MSDRKIYLLLLLANILLWTSVITYRHYKKPPQVQEVKAVVK